MTKQELIRKYIKRASYNLLCYSENYLMTVPKNGYEKEWNETQEELKLLSEISNEIDAKFFKRRVQIDGVRISGKNYYFDRYSQLTGFDIDICRSEDGRYHAYIEGHYLGIMTDNEKDCQDWKELERHKEFRKIAVIENKSLRQVYSERLYSG